MSRDETSISIQSVSGGVFVSALTPFTSEGDVALDHVISQARLLTAIPGVKGVAINRTIHDGCILSTSEQIAVTQAVRKHIEEHAILLSYIGEPQEGSMEAVERLKVAGADVVICSADTVARPENADQAAHWIQMTRDFGLPIIIAPMNGTNHPIDVQSALAVANKQVLGFELGAENDVADYDRAYYALKALDRPIAVLAASQATLFHNLNTGGDGVLSWLANVVPHEVVALYQATQEGRFYDAQAIHTKLAPLAALLSSYGSDTRELILRQAAHHQGILSSPWARDTKTTLSTEVVSRIVRTLDEMPLRPVTDS